MKPLLACLLLGTVAMAQNTFTRKIEGDIKAWNSSASPEYYRGEGEQGGVDFVNDPERGQVVRCKFGFGDAEKSEPVFITRKLDPKPPRLEVLTVRFWAKLSAPLINPENGFILRLRTSDTAHDNWNVLDAIGKPFPIGEWVQVEIDAGTSSKARNIWGKVFDSIREMTFRLDDIDDLNGAGELLIDDIEIVLTRPPAEQTYTPKISERPTNPHPRILLLRHAAAGYYKLPEALQAVAKDVQIDEFLYRGRHFEFFGMAKEREAFLAYDAIIMLDIDPFVLTNSQALGIADAVASGTSLIAFGGTVSFSDAKAAPTPLREAFPVTFSLTKNASKATVTPALGPDHVLNRGFSPALLGRVACRQPLTPKPGTDIPWTAGDMPMVIAGTFHQGRTVVVNAQAQYLRLGKGDLFLSPLADDLVRRLMAYALHREPTQGIEQIQVGAVPIGGGTVTGTVKGGPALRVFLDDTPVAVGEDGTFSLALPTPNQAQEHHQLRLEAWDGRKRIDWRDIPLVVQHALDLQTTWTRNRFTFVPDGQVELDLTLRARDVPKVSAGSATEIRYLDRWPVSIGSFADIWLMKEGASYHNQAGPVDVKVETQPGIRPAYQISGIARAARPKENTKYAEDDRVLDCTRAIRCLPNGEVAINNTFRVRQDLNVQRLPLTISLPVSRYAGLPYRVLVGETVTEGVFPAKTAKRVLFDVKGGALEIQTPDGPLRIEVTDPNIRIWCQDLRKYKMTSFRLEIEAPIGKGPAKKGLSYRIPIRIQGPVPGSGSELPEGDGVTLSAEIRDGRNRQVWTVPQSGEGGTHFAGKLPGLQPGHYQLVTTATSPNGPLVTRTTDCFVVDPLPTEGFYPLMCYVDYTADGHCLDPEGIRARLQDMKEAGFNTAAISGPTSLASERPSPGRDVRALCETVAAQLGMAITFEYSNFTTYRRNATPTPCPFTPAAKEALANKLKSRVDIANRTARLLTAKVVDEPHLSMGHIDLECPHCQAEFKAKYGIELKDVDGNKEPYAMWCRADFGGHLIDEVFKLGAEYKEANATGSWELLLTYMATGLGYQNPQRTVQDALDWTRHVKWVDFDIYPYFYPASQRVRMVQASYGMSYMREVARARGIPWGFYVEIDDRNWPFQKNPKEASAECAFTAVAHGADYLNTFIHRLASTGCGSRPERWDLAKEAFQEINKLGPMLAELPALRSRLALLHPNADEMIREGYARPDHTLELLKGVFGDLDVLPEEIVQESGTIPYAALLLLDVEFLHADAIAPLQQWIADGGVLICDRLPTKTHRNQPIVWQNLAKPTTAPDGVRTRALGKGRIVFLPENPETDLQALAEAKTVDPEALATSVQQLASRIEAAVGPMPMRIAVKDLAEGEPCVDTVVASLRGDGKQRLLTIVNHRSVPVEATITLDDLETWRYRDALAKSSSVRSRKDTLTIELPPRGHRVLLGRAK